MSDQSNQGEGHPSATDDVKAKFKEALDRKKSGGRNPAGNTGDQGKIHEAHGVESHRKEFRRKSG